MKTNNKNLSQFESAVVKHFENLSKEVIKPVDVEALKLRYKNFRQGRRLAPRFSIQFEVVIYSKNGKSIRTQSLNVSSSGALLSSELPADFIDGPLDIVFVWQRETSKKYMAFHGKAVGGPHQSSRITFTSSTANSQEILFSAFEDLTPLAELGPSRRV